MGFCRYCGEIVAPNARCCGSVSMPPITSKGFMRQDRWSKTYVSNEPPPPPPPQAPANDKPSQRRFPRPLNSIESSRPRKEMSSDISAGISSRSRIMREPSPTKTIQPLPEAGILPALSSDSDSPSLTKVYGSLLSNDRNTEFCDQCQQPFVAEDTLYPRVGPPETSANKFLCRECFIHHGGTRGTCNGCSKPVLILKSEGGFIEIGQHVYHKPCFVCTGCGENASDKPMVDLLGRPCCSKPECFDTCLSRKTPTKPLQPVDNRRGSRALEELSSRLSAIGSKSSTAGSSITSSPKRREQSVPRASRPSLEAIEEMKRRFMSKDEDSSVGKGLNIDLGSSFSSLVSESPIGLEPSVRLSRSPTRTDVSRMSSTPEPQGSPSDYRRIRARSMGREAYDRHPSQSSFRENPSTTEMRTSITNPSVAGSRNSSRYELPPEPNPDTNSEQPLLSRSSPFTKSNSVSAALPSGMSSAPFSGQLESSISESIYDRHPSPSLHKSRSSTDMRLSTTAGPRTSSRYEPPPTPFFDTEPKRSLLSRSSLYMKENSASAALPSAMTSAPFSGQLESSTSESIYDRHSPPPSLFKKPSLPEMRLSISSTSTAGPRTSSRYEPPPEPTPDIEPKRSPLPRSSPFIKTNSASAALPSAMSSSSSVGQSESPTNESMVKSPTFTGAPNKCPGCNKTAFAMERGVVPGPHATRWHSACLVCATPDCRKKLDAR
ncbi:hypothetical protein DL96DRAFT_29755 [Flagelloscypha sp. PMI_526]|nr:hypothetical protein DL96DRAFT_29755 [Flagelloscypha sp. PMI_526]